MSNAKLVVPYNLRVLHDRIRHELGKYLSEAGYGDDIASNPIIAEAFDAVMPPACEMCGEKFTFARLIDWRGAWEKAPWWSAPRLCEKCTIEEERRERQRERAKRIAADNLDSIELPNGDIV